ncbi:MAG: DUF488 family protein [Pseudorhodoplanes sp.]
MSKKTKLFTIGYEKAAPAAVLGELKAVGVELLVDTRAIAASRRPGFSKRQLAAGLADTGIDYLHLQKLGTPTEGRQAARSGDTAKLWKIYSRHLATADAQEQLDELTALVKSGRRICLLCFERDVGHCHRRWIAEAIHDRLGTPVENLVPPLF